MRTELLFRVESDDSKKLEADVPASCTDSLFSKPPQSGMAEEQPLIAITQNVLTVEQAHPIINLEFLIIKLPVRLGIPPILRATVQC